MAKVLILAGDAAEDLETMFVKYRLVEAGHEPYVAAPTTRPIKLVVHDFEPEWDTYVEKPGRTCPVDVAFADVDPTSFAAVVIPGGRAPEFIRVDPEVRRIVEHFFEEDKPVGTLCHGPQVPAALGLLRGRRSSGFGPLAPDIELAGGGVRRRCSRCRREHGVVPRLGRSRRVVARVSGVPRSRGRTRVTPNRVVIPRLYGRRLHARRPNGRYPMISVRRPSPGARDLVCRPRSRTRRHELRGRLGLAEEQRRHSTAEGLRGHVREGQEPLLAASRLRIRPAACRACRPDRPDRTGRASRTCGPERARAGRHDVSLEQRRASKTQATTCPTGKRLLGGGVRLNPLPRPAERPAGVSRTTTTSSVRRCVRSPRRRRTGRSRCSRSARPRAERCGLAGEGRGSPREYADRVERPADAPPVLHA